MPVSFDNIVKGREYSRNTLAEIWGYSGYQALARGVVTPRADNKVILFVTEHKQDSSEQFADRLDGKLLNWEGPNDHFAEKRIIRASTSGDQIHLFYRVRHHMDFTYLGRLVLLTQVLHTSKPSIFTFRVTRAQSR